MDVNPVAETPSVRFWLAFCIASLGNLLFGYDLSNISGVLPTLTSQFHLDTTWQELIASMVSVAAVVFALLGGPAGDFFGRKPCIIIAAGFCGVGSAVLSAAQTKEMLLIGRFLEGAGIGLYTATGMVYIAEGSPKHLRGRLVSGSTLFINAAILLASISDAAFSYVNQGWRYAFGLGVVPALVIIMVFPFLDESPRWLAEHGKLEQARVVMRTFRLHETAADQEIDHVQLAVEKERMERLQQGGGMVLWKMLREAPIRRALVVGCLLQAGQQFTGISIVLYYSTTIIRMAGVEDAHMAMWLSCATSAVLLVTQTIGALLSDKLGRRSLILASLFGMGALPWVINTEIYPQWARSTGNACSVGVNWSVSLLTSISFLSLIKAITRPGVYYLYAGISAVGFLFFLGNLPETKGKSLEEVQALFAHPWCHECMPRTRENVVSPTDDLSE